MNTFAVNFMTLISSRNEPNFSWCGRARQRRESINHRAGPPHNKSLERCHRGYTLQPKQQKQASSMFLSPGRKITRWEKTGVLVAAIFLAISWAQVLTYIAIGNPYAHRNYWGQDVGTFSLAAISYLGTIVLAIVWWRHWFLNSRPGKALLSRFADKGALTARSTRTRKKSTRAG